MACMQYLCPVCWKKGKTVVLQLFYINFTTAVYKCPVINCIYPIGYEWIYVNKNVLDSNSSDMGYDSDDVEAMIEDDLKELEDSVSTSDTLNNFENDLMDLSLESNDSTYQADSNSQGNLNVLDHEPNNDSKELFSVLDQPKNTADLRPANTENEDNLYQFAIDPNLTSKLDNITNISAKSEPITIKVKLCQNNTESNDIIQPINSDCEDDDKIVEHLDSSTEGFQPEKLEARESNLKNTNKTQQLICKDEMKSEITNLSETSQDSSTTRKKPLQKAQISTKATKETLNVFSELNSLKPTLKFYTKPSLKTKPIKLLPDQVIKRVSKLESNINEPEKYETKKKTSLLNDILKNIRQKGYKFRKNSDKIPTKSSAPCENDGNSSADACLTEFFDNIDNIKAVNDVPDNSYDISEIDDWLSKLCS